MAIPFKVIFGNAVTAIMLESCRAPLAVHTLPALTERGADS